MSSSTRRARRPPVTAVLALAPRMQRQFGVFTTAQAAEVGVSSQRIAELLLARAVRRVYRGVYVSTQYPSSWEAIWMAGLLAAGPDAVISGLAAAFLHGLRHVGAASRPELEITIPRRANHRTSGPRVVTEVHLTEVDTARHGVWRLTSVAWTLFTLAHALGVDDTERALDAAIADGLLTTNAAGANVRILDGDGRRRYIDFVYRDLGIAIEIDVHRDHGRSIGRHLDGRRQNALAGEFGVILRFDELDLRYAPATVAAEVRRALELAGASL